MSDLRYVACGLFSRTAMRSDVLFNGWHLFVPIWTDAHHLATVNQTYARQATEWCEERWGRAMWPYGEKGERVWATRGTGILIRRDADAFEFKMRWC